MKNEKNKKVSMSDVGGYGTSNKLRKISLDNTANVSGGSTAYITVNKCPNCGAEIWNGSSFCESCGWSALPADFLENHI